MCVCAISYHFTNWSICIQSFPCNLPVRVYNFALGYVEFNLPAIGSAGDRIKFILQDVIIHLIT